MSKARWLILADDLTGAADAGAAFARAGLRTEIAWQVNSAAPDIDVQAIDLDSRGRDPDTAAALHREAVLTGLAPGESLFKKIDSTLRGPFGREIAAVSVALRECGRPGWGLLAPANPAMGRTMRDGRVFVAGVPLEQTVTWKRGHTHASADLGEIVRAAGMRPVKLLLAQVRAGPPALRAAMADAAASASANDGIVLLCDAETGEDLDRIVAAAGASSPPGFYIGTAGLANALAGHAATAAPFALPASNRGALVAVGTLARVSRAALERLARHCGRDILHVDPANPSVPDLASPLSRGEPVLALLDAPDTGGPPDSAQVRAFAAALDAALPHLGALIVTGGETAAALLARCRVRGVRLLGEIEPGVALGVTQGAVEVPLVTKPGAFGDEDSLVRCYQQLNRLRSNA